MSEWTTYSLGDVSQVFDGPHATPKKTERGPWFLSISSLDGGRLNLSESAHLSEEDFIRWTRRVTPEPGDVLFSYETRLGNAALMHGGVRACLGRRMGLLRPYKRVVDPRFLLFAYLSPEFQATIQSRKIHGATVDRIPLVDLSTWPIRLPALAEQRAIAGMLGALDDKIAVNERISETSVALAISRFEETIDGGISTPSTTLGELAAAQHLEISDGYRTKKPEHGHPGIPILRVSEVSGFKITPSFSDFVSDRFRRQMGNKISRPGDVILTTKGTVGRTAMMPRGGQEFVYSPQICFFRAAQSSPISAEFLLLWMHGQEFWQQAASLKGQTDMADYLSLRDIRSMSITVPDPELCKRIHATASLLLSQAETRRQESDTLAALRDTLLPQLMSGTLRVRDVERIVEDAV
ncbi:MAG: restriction endonuclease subunit S [Actinobacteria bacterium]|nr:restriction endonuclease subunit S [Actinomycetota bacterium]